MSEPLDLEDIQGLVVRGYKTLPFANFLLLHVADPDAARATLLAWTDEATSAATAPESTALNIAVTGTGVHALHQVALGSGFSEPFTSGMATTYRSRLLGDTGADDPAHWRWGGPNTPAVHVMVLLYASEEQDLAALVGRVESEARAAGIDMVERLGTDELSDREPFGFRDGISQPVLEGLPRARAGQDVVRAGEFVLGYVNEYGQRGERPLLDPAADPDGHLPRDPDGTGAPDLGRNGSYLVLRQLRQEVSEFWTWVERQASTHADGAVAQADPARRDLLAAKLVGRWPSGAPLVLAPEQDDPALGDRNDFQYHESDARGHACPIGAHIRRTNPRDSLEPGPGTERSREVNRRHRLLRRGRTYSELGPDGAAVERGLHFVCLNSHLPRQFEFVQHSWVNDPSFNALYDSSDPLVAPLGRANGAGATFAIQAAPLRRRVRGVPQFVRVRGGAYFFLPGIRALRYLMTGRT